MALRMYQKMKTIFLIKREKSVKIKDTIVLSTFEIDIKSTIIFSTFLLIGT